MAPLARGRGQAPGPHAAWRAGSFRALGPAIVVGLAGASLLDLPGARRVELLPAPLLAPLLALLAPLRPAVAPAGPELAELLASAPAVGAAWQAELVRRPPPPAGRELALLAVAGRDPVQGFLWLEPDGLELQPGSPVTHRGVLVGRVGWGTGAPLGPTRVSLVGSTGSPPLAARFHPEPGAAPVDVLILGGSTGPVLARPSRGFELAGLPLVHTRDVQALGETLPAGFLLGRIESDPIERPGGALLPRDTPLRVRLAPLIEPLEVDLVVAEVPRGWTGAVRAVEAAVLAGRADRSALLVDRGRADGLRVGDLVTQGGLLVGWVTDLAARAARVERGPPPGPLVVESVPGVLDSWDPSRSPWPEAGPLPAGQGLYLPTTDAGALLVGRVVLRGGRAHLLGFAGDLGLPLVVRSR